MTGILSEQIALEIDREILADLVNGATAATFTGHAHRVFSLTPPALRLAHLRLLQTSPVPFLSGTRPSLRQSTMFPLRFTARLFAVVLTSSSVDQRSQTSLSSPLVSVLRSLLMHETGSIGAVQVGSLSKKFDVIVDPYFLRNVILVGRRGSASLKAVMCMHHTYHSRPLQQSSDQKTSYHARVS